MSKPRNRAQGKTVSPCAHPGCRKTIREGTWNFPTGFCLDHQPVKEAPARENVRRVRVPVCGISLGEGRFDRVSLAKEPWL